MATPKQRKRVHKDVLLIKDGNVTEIAHIEDAAPDEPALRATIDKHDRKRKGLWMTFTVADEGEPKP